MRCPQVGPGRQASIFCGSSLERATAADLLAQRLRVEHDSFKFEDLDRALPAEEAGRFDLLGGGLVRRGVVQGIDGCESRHRVITARWVSLRQRAHRRSLAVCETLAA